MERADIELQVEKKPPSLEMCTERHLPDRNGYGKTDAFNPFMAGEYWDVRVSHSRMKAVARSMGQAKELGFILPEVLRKPTAIFQGIREEGESEWLCYCGLPSHSYHKDGTRRAPYEDEVYLVFVNADRVAYNSRWEKCDPDNPKVPSNIDGRFHQRLH